MSENNVNELIVKGYSPLHISRVTGVSLDKARDMVDNYFNAMQAPDIHVLVLRQLSRLDVLIDSLISEYEDEGLSAKMIDSLRGLIGEYSDVAGLRRNNISVEVKIFQDKQIDLLYRFVQDLSANLLNTIIEKGDIDKVKGSWDFIVADSAREPARLLSNETIKVNM